MSIKKALSTILLLAVLGAAIPATVEAQGGMRYTVTVSKFENRAGWHGQWDIGDAWGAVLTDILQQSGKFVVLGETDMRYEAMAEQDLAASGRTAQGRKTPTQGQLTPAQILIKGQITHVQHSTSGGKGGVRVGRIKVGGSSGKAEINATMYMVDSTTGQVLASTSVVGKAGRKGASFGYSGRDLGGNLAGFKKDNLGKAVESAVSDGVDWMIGQIADMPWRGSVALVKGGQIYINRGSREGVTSGQTFIVGSADVIRDPETGEVLDESVNEIARLKATSVKEKLTICEVVSGSAGRVKKGMMIALP